MKKPPRFFLAFMTASVVMCLLHFTVRQNTPVFNSLKTKAKVEEDKETGAEKQLVMWFQSKGYPEASNLNDKYEAAWKNTLN